MKELYFREFTNRSGDTVKLTLSADSFGGFHLVTRCERVRHNTEKRVIGGRLTDIPVMTFTDEREHAQFPTEFSGLTELNLHRVMNNDPLFSSEDFQAWQAATTEQDTK